MVGVAGEEAKRCPWEGYIWKPKALIMSKGMRVHLFLLAWTQMARRMVSVVGIQKGEGAPTNIDKPCVHVVCSQAILRLYVRRSTNG